MDEILHIIEQIKQIYTVLAQLEITGENNSEYYLATLKNLQDLIKKEQNLYQNLALSNAEIFELKKKDDEPIYQRIINNLSHNIQDIINNKVTEDMEEEKKCLCNEGFKVIELITSACQNDLVLTRLFFEDEYLKNTTFRKIKEKIIISKYADSFINSSDVEHTLISNKFKIKDNYQSAYLVVTLLDLPKDLTTPTIDDYYLITLDLNIKQLLNIEDINYNDSQNVYLSLIFQCRIKAILCLISEERFNIIKEKIMNEINKCENHISKNILKSIMDNIRQEKGKIKVLSFYQPLF